MRRLQMRSRMEGKEREGCRPWVLIVGGSGYLGLHLLHSFSISKRTPIAFTYHSKAPPPPSLLPHFVRAFHVDLASGDGLHALAQAFHGPPQSVINCAAISIPQECEKNPSIAMAVNVPEYLVRWLSGFATTNPPLLIHLSTDQVYEGTKSFYNEDDETKPVNVYGKSKVAAEEFIRENWPNYVILRSSIIYGPQPFIPVKKSLPIQWIDSVLSSGQEGRFFKDEYRCPVFVNDVVKVAEVLIDRHASGSHVSQHVFNLGGPTRLSRAEMAVVVADVRGFDKSLIKYISASEVNRGVPSPADISMDVSRLISTLGIQLTNFDCGVKLTLNIG